MANLDEMKAAYEKAARSGDFQQMGEQLCSMQVKVHEYPQSGERLGSWRPSRGAEGYSGATGKAPGLHIHIPSAETHSQIVSLIVGGGA